MASVSPADVGETFSHCSEEMQLGTGGGVERRKDVSSLSWIAGIFPYFFSVPYFLSSFGSSKAEGAEAHVQGGEGQT